MDAYSPLKPFDKRPQPTNNFQTIGPNTTLINQSVNYDFSKIESKNARILKEQQYGIEIIPVRTIGSY